VRAAALQAEVDRNRIAIHHRLRNRKADDLGERLRPQPRKFVGVDGPGVEPLLRVGDLVGRRLAGDPPEFNLTGISKSD